MGKLIIRLVINAVALWVAAAVVHGLLLRPDFVGVLIVAVIFGLVNAVIKPIIVFCYMPDLYSYTRFVYFCSECAHVDVNRTVISRVIDGRWFYPGTVGGYCY